MTNLRQALLDLAARLEKDATDHLTVSQLAAAVFSRDPPNGHAASCGFCQDLVLQERAQNPLYLLWLEDPAIFDP